MFLLVEKETKEGDTCMQPKTCQEKMNNGIHGSRTQAVPLERDQLCQLRPSWAGPGTRLSRTHLVGIQKTQVPG